MLLGFLQDVHYKVARKADRANHRQKTTRTAGNFPLPTLKQAPRHLILAPCKEQRCARTHPQPGVIWHQALSEIFHEPNQHAAPLQPRRRILYLLWITLSDVHTASEQVMSLLSKSFMSSLHLLFVGCKHNVKLGIWIQFFSKFENQKCLFALCFVQFYKKTREALQLFMAALNCYSWKYSSGNRKRFHARCSRKLNFAHDLLRKENSDSLIAVSTSNGKLQKKKSWEWILNFPKCQRLYAKRNLTHPAALGVARSIHGSTIQLLLKVYKIEAH